jgi:hypothetical protein
MPSQFRWVITFILWNWGISYAHQLFIAATNSQRLIALTHSYTLHYPVEQEIFYG